MMRETFNEVIMHKSIYPVAWKGLTRKVMYKKGDVERAECYRPICTLPTLAQSVMNTSVQQALQQL